MIKWTILIEFHKWLVLLQQLKWCSRTTFTGWIALVSRNLFEKMRMPYPINRWIDGRYFSISRSREGWDCWVLMFSFGRKAEKVAWCNCNSMVLHINTLAICFWCCTSAICMVGGWGGHDPLPFKISVAFFHWYQYCPVWHSPTSLRALITLVSLSLCV